MPEPAIDFSERADLVEQMDGPCSYEELRLCLRDLALLNRVTRAHRPILKWVEEMARARKPGDRPLRVVDMGSGYGDMLRRMDGWAERAGIAVELVGIDVNAKATRAAREATPGGSKIRWVTGDVYSSAEAADADVVTTCGVLHHLCEPEIVRFLRWMEETARVGWIIVDLHRKPVPYRIFDWTMRCGAWHPYIRPDGLRSIRRSFLEEDWERMCAAAGIDVGKVEIRGCRPARLSISRLKRV